MAEGLTGTKICSEQGQSAGAVVARVAFVGESKGVNARRRGIRRRSTRPIYCTLELLAVFSPRVWLGGGAPRVLHGCARTRRSLLCCRTSRESAAALVTNLWCAGEFIASVRNYPDLSIWRERPTTKRQTDNQAIPRRFNLRLTSHIERPSTDFSKCR